MKRDCECKRVQHRHGTWLAYSKDLCRCQPCRNAWADYCRHSRTRRYLAGGSLFTDATGTARRLQALTAIGWSAEALAREIGQTHYCIQQWRIGSYEYVHVKTHAKVAALYDRLWNTYPTGNGATRARRYAARLGWPVPLAWDDDEIDSPDARPHTPGNGTWEHKPCGTEAAARRHQRKGEPLCHACATEAARVARERVARREERAS